MFNSELRDAAKCELYHEFYEQNTKLFERDQKLYWNQCFIYVENKFKTKLKELDELKAKKKERVKSWFESLRGYI